MDSQVQKRIDGIAGHASDLRDEVELSDEELEHVVGGLERPWSPDSNVLRTVTRETTVMLPQA